MSTTIDLNDKMCRIDRSRRTYKWYIRIDRKCIAWAMFNAYIIEEKFRQHGQKRDLRQFQLEVIHKLVGENRFRSRKRGRPASTDNVPARITDTPHMPSMSYNNDHRCHVCVAKHRRYNRSHPEASYADNPFKKAKTSLRCDGCNVFLCTKKGSECWKDWHSKFEFWRWSVVLPWNMYSVHYDDDMLCLQETVYNMTMICCRRHWTLWRYVVPAGDSAIWRWYV